jgi:hypothetical protein
VTATYDERRRARLVDSTRASAVDAARQAEGARLADPLTGPRPQHVFDAESEPIYAALVAERGVPGQDHVGPGPVLVGRVEAPTLPLRLATAGA